MIDIKNFGAKGDGVTDDSLALQTAIDFAAEDKVCPDCNSVTLTFMIFSTSPAIVILHK